MKKICFAIRLEWVNVLFGAYSATHYICSISVDFTTMMQSITTRDLVSNVFNRPKRPSILSIRHTYLFFLSALRTAQSIDSLRIVVQNCQLQFYVAKLFLRGASVICSQADAVLHTWLCKNWRAKDAMCYTICFCFGICYTCVCVCVSVFLWLCFDWCDFVGMLVCVHVPCPEWRLWLEFLNKEQAQVELYHSKTDNCNHWWASLTADG